MEELRKQRIAVETSYREQGKVLKRLIQEKQRRSAIVRVQDVRNTKRHISDQKTMMPRLGLMDFG